MIRNKKHLSRIRALPCLADSRHDTYDIQAAHIRIYGDGGMGMKPGDDHAVPLCQKCHAEQHRIGERTFWKNVFPTMDDPVRFAHNYAKMLYKVMESVE